MTNQVFPDCPDDVCIIDAVRTPITRANKGAFAKTRPEVLLSACLKALSQRTGLPTGKVEDICVGNVLGIAGSANVSRMAALHAGYPVSTAVSTCNRQCSSGLQAVAHIAAAITAGSIDIGIGAGMESMTMDLPKPSKLERSDLQGNASGTSNDPGKKAVGGPGLNALSASAAAAVAPEMLQVKEAADCLIPMGVTSEIVATRFGITRSEQDAFAVDSHAKAAKARREGLFDSEIVPVTVSVPAGKDSAETVTVTVSQDDGIREGVTEEALAKLKPAFVKPGSAPGVGTTTAGNASQVSDGAAAVLLARRSTALALGLPIRAVWRGFVAVGVPPEIMGIGPALAIPMVLRRAVRARRPLTLAEDIEVVELNEAFASQAVYCMQKLALRPDQVNPCGGAIALGHPLGATGARQLATLVPELHRRMQKKGQKRCLGIASMCIGSGMGAAALIEAVVSGQEDGSNGCCSQSGPCNQACQKSRL